MRWVTLRTGDAERPGLVLDGSIHVLAGAEQIVDLLGDNGDALADAADRARTNPVMVVDYQGADLAPPLRPPQIRDFLTFLDHLRNAGAAANMDLNQAWHEIPAFYFSNAAAVVGPYDPVRISPGCARFDYELEVAAIVGRAGSNLHPDEAERHIAGFTILNDWSARDIQVHEMQLRLGPAKGKDGANTLGPMFVTIDELEQFRQGNSFHLEMSGYVNDELISHGYLDQMDWSWGEMLAYASRGTSLRPGDVIGSGTVPTGCLFEHFALQGEEFRGFLEAGDIVRFDVEQLGTICQEVREPVAIHRLRTGF